MKYRVGRKRFGSREAAISYANEIFARSGVVVAVEAVKPRRRSAMDIAAEACGLVKVRGAVSGKIYYE